MEQRASASHHCMQVELDAPSAAPTAGTAWRSTTAGRAAGQRQHQHPPIMAEHGRRSTRGGAVRGGDRARSAQAQRLGGVAHVAVAAQRLADEERLDVLEAHVLEPVAVAHRARRPRSRRGWRRPAPSAPRARRRDRARARCPASGGRASALQRGRIEAGERLAIALRVRRRGSASASGGMSSRRSRSGGRWISTVFSRKSRSCRKRPAATSALQVGVGRREQPHVDLRASATSRPARTRRSRARAAASAAGRAARWRSRRGTACRRRPARSGRRDRACASVKAPFTWPNSSLSNTPSETPPALTVTSGRAARGETACSACATSSLPVPFSPVISTLASDGPTRSISSQHRPHRRRLGDERGAAVAVAARGSPPRAARPRRRRAPSSTCVRTIASSRSLSHGFWTKSRAPRRIASTARSTLPQAVITTTGSVGVELPESARAGPALPAPDVVSRA